MSTLTPGSQFGLDLFDALEIAYEQTYNPCPPKIACINHSISLLPTNSRVLDVGCGSGAPVVEMLSNAGLDVHAFDISPKMVEWTRSRFKGTFEVADMVEYEPKGKFMGVFLMFSHLSLSYASFHDAVSRLSQALEPGGIFVIGQVPTEKYVTRANDPAWDETKSYVEDYDVPFMGHSFPTLMMSAEGQRELLRSMGFEIVYETISLFQPADEKCEPEEHQYVIAKRPLGSSGEVLAPKPLPGKA